MAAFAKDDNNNGIYKWNGTGGCFFAQGLNYSADSSELFKWNGQLFTHGASVPTGRYSKCTDTIMFDNPMFLILGGDSSKMFKWNGSTLFEYH